MDDDVEDTRSASRVADTAVSTAAIKETMVQVCNYKLWQKLRGAAPLTSGYTRWCQTPTLRERSISSTGWVLGPCRPHPKDGRKGSGGWEGGQEQGPKGLVHSEKPRPWLALQPGLALWCQGCVRGPREPGWVSLLRQAGNRGGAEQKGGCGSQSHKRGNRGSWYMPDTLEPFAAAGGRQMRKARAVQDRGHHTSEPWGGGLPQTFGAHAELLGCLQIHERGSPPSFPTRRHRERPA